MVVMGTDYPTLSNVVSFQVPISGITVSGNGQTNVPVLDAPATIDFSELMGLQTLVDIKPLQAGSYTSATITFGGNPTLWVLDTTATPPAVTTLPAQFSAMSATVSFPQAITVAAGQTLGMTLDFRMGQSIPVDSSGNIVETGNPATVVVTPVVKFNFLYPPQDKFEVDELRGGVTSIGSSGTFVMQGPGGRTFTVSTNSNTTWSPSGQSYSTLTTSDIVVVEEGVVDPSTLMVDASEVDVITDHFLVNGLVTYANPPASSGSTGCATALSLLVRAAIPGSQSANIPAGQITTINLTGSEAYWVGHLDWLGQFLSVNFGSCSLVPGQHLVVGGTVDTSGTVLTPKHVMLAVQGFAGTAASAVSGTTFTFNANGVAGVLLPSPVTVATIQTALISTELVNLSSFSAITPGMSLRVGGLVLYNPTTKTANILAGRIVQPTS
jgi:hypothetical protein